MARGRSRKDGPLPCNSYQDARGEARPDFDEASVPAALGSDDASCLLVGVPGMSKGSENLHAMMTRLRASPDAADRQLAFAIDVQGPAA